MQWAIIISTFSLVISGLSLWLTWHRGRLQAEQQLSRARGDLLIQLAELQWSFHLSADSYRTLARVVRAGNYDKKLADGIEELATDMGEQAKLVKELFASLDAAPNIPWADLETYRAKIERIRVSHRAIREQIDGQRRALE